jgi:hypothetical protein
MASIVGSPVGLVFAATLATSAGHGSRSIPKVVVPPGDALTSHVPLLTGVDFGCQWCSDAFEDGELGLGTFGPNRPRHER